LLRKKFCKNGQYDPQGGTGESFNAIFWEIFSSETSQMPETYATKQGEGGQDLIVYINYKTTIMPIDLKLAGIVDFVESLHAKFK